MPWKLLWRNLLGHPIRSLLTVLSVATAVFLICTLQAVVAGMTRSIDAASANRLVVQSAVSLFVDLPLAYEGKIAAVPGVERTIKWTWFGARYEQEKGGFFVQFGIDPGSFLPSYPELSITAGSYEDFAKSRTGCIVGVETAAKYGWQVGQTIPLVTPLFVRNDGKPWEFTIQALYTTDSPAMDKQTMYFHFDYLRESLEQGSASGPEGTSIYVVRLAPGTDPIGVQRAIDEMFANGPQRVQTTTEAEFNRQFVSMMGDVPSMMRLIGGAVLFAIFFAVLNTMLMAAHERTRDLGVLKAVGFSNGVAGALLLGESLLLCGLGAALGGLGAKAMESPMAMATAQFMPGFGFDRDTMYLAVGIAIGVGLLAGVLPALRAIRLTPITALREVG